MLDIGSILVEKLVIAARSIKLRVIEGAILYVLYYILDLLSEFFTYPVLHIVLILINGSEVMLSYLFFFRISGDINCKRIWGVIVWMFFYYIDEILHVKVFYRWIILPRVILTSWNWSLICWVVPIRQKGYNFRNANWNPPVFYNSL